MTTETSDSATEHSISNRFRGFLPVVIDVETGGFNAQTDAILELAASILSMDDEGQITAKEVIDFQVKPFVGANLEASALEFTGIDPDAPNRNAISESDAMHDLFRQVRAAVKAENCTRAILVGHNAHFDHGFITAASNRCAIKRNPFHPFSCFDTATLSGLAYGQTVLAKACQTAGIKFDNKSAHSAAYDVKKTAELFCMIVNRWQGLGGWPIEITG